MSEYRHVEKPFLDQLAALGWEVVDQGCGRIPADPAASLRESFRQWLLPGVFRDAVRAINRTEDGRPWLTDAQLADLRDQLLRQPNLTLLEANEAVQRLIFKAQVDRNELTGEEDPVVRLIDFGRPENNRFTAVNQFRIDTPGAVKTCIIPDIVLFVNGMPLAVVECKIGGPTCANPMHEAFVQLLRYRNGRPETAAAGLREGEPRLFHFNLLLIRTCGEKADFGTITSDEGHYFGWKEIWPEALEDFRPPPGGWCARRSAWSRGCWPRRTCSACCAPVPCSWIPTTGGGSRWWPATSSFAPPAGSSSGCGRERRRPSAPGWSGTPRDRVSRSPWSSWRACCGPRRT